MKYIIEIAEEYEEYFKGVLICGIADGKFAVDVIAREDLEELNSDYINEHFGSLQDEAYKAGMNKAWGLAEDVIYNRGNVLDILHCATVGAAFDKYSAGQALDILRAYKKKQIEDDRIEVGDEVRTRDGAPSHTFLVTKVTDSHVYGISDDGSWNYWTKGEVTKTDKHYDIASILEAMRE